MTIEFGNGVNVATGTSAQAGLLLRNLMPSKVGLSCRGLVTEARTK